MKKFFMCFLIVGVLFISTACGKEESNDGKKDGKYETLTCTLSETDEAGMKTETSAVVKYNGSDKKVVSIDQTVTTEVNPQIADLTVNLTSAVAEAFNKIDGMSMKVTKENDTTIKSVTSIDYTKINVENMKETLGDMFDEENAMYTKDVTIDSLKDTALKGYTCK